MRFYVEGTLDVSLTEMLAKRGLVEGQTVRRIAGEIGDSKMMEVRGVQLKNHVELGIASGEVTQAEIDTFMGRNDVQDRLQQMLELKWSLEHDMCVALNLDFVESLDVFALEHVMLERREGKPG